MSPTSHDPTESPEMRARIAVATKLVEVVVAQMKRHLAAHVRVDDMTSFANEGAIIAARTFDPQHGVPFERWASLKIRSAVVDGLRADGELTRTLYRKLRALEAVTSLQEGMLYDAASSPPGSAELADARLSDHLAAMATAFATGVLITRDEEKLDSVKDTALSPEEEVARRELHSAVRAAIADRPDAERTLLERYYFDGVTMEQASGGLSKSWACRLHARAIEGVTRSLRRAKISV